MGHEIRTPMNVLELTELVLQTELNERRRKFIGSSRTRRPRA